MHDRRATGAGLNSGGGGGGVQGGSIRRNQRAGDNAYPGMFNSVAVASSPSSATSANGTSTTSMYGHSTREGGHGSSSSINSSTSSSHGQPLTRQSQPFMANDAFSSPVERLSPVSAPTPWNTAPTRGSNQAYPSAARTSPDVSALYGRIGSPSSPNVYSHLRQQGTDYIRSGIGAGSTAVINADDDDQSLFQRDSLLLPRRNHTIASSAAAYRKRLDRHFQQQLPATSPSKNSLSAITGGKEDADDDWEAMMKRRESLIPGDEEEHEELDSSPWKPIPMASAHRRYPSQPTSTFGTSPIGTHSPVSAASMGKGSYHQRSESAHVNPLTEGPFASSPIVPGSAFGSNSGVVRRHQSLNYHTGRNMAGRVHQHQHRGTGGLGSPALSLQAIEAGLDTVTNTASSPAQSPIGTASLPFSERASLLTGSPRPNGATGKQPSYERLQDVGATSSSTQLSSSLMDAHAQLARMSLHSGQMSLRENPLAPEARRKLPTLITDRDDLARSAAAAQQGAALGGGPASASAYVPPIGHAHHRRNSSASSPVAYIPRSEARGAHRTFAQGTASLRGPQTAFPVHGGWQAKGNFAGGQTPTQSDQNNSTPTATPSDMRDSGIGAFPLDSTGQTGSQRFNPLMGMHQQSGMHPFLDARLQGLNATQVARLASLPAFGESFGGNFGSYPNPANPNIPPGFGPMHYAPSAPLAGPHSEPFVDPAVRALIASKGYNPSVTQFNVNPPKARFFVIKSFTEDDVQRSLKHEIWASTEKGNQRLDRAFKESSTEGPLYLLFSVNASGHFCGMAEMLTPLDYSSNSNVWAQEGKWKGTFRVRWIYVKDVPNNKLRHIRLTNTADCKPITQSRDTQELPSDGGRQALKIIAEFPSRTSLLQDWMFYEQQNRQTAHSTDDGNGATAAVNRSDTVLPAGPPQVKAMTHGAEDTLPMQQSASPHISAATGVQDGRSPALHASMVGQMQ